MDADPKTMIQEPTSSAFHALPCSRLITQAELENVLTHEGIVEHNAIEDPFGYDNGKTELAVSIAARALDEIARQKTAHLIEALEIIAGLRPCLDNLLGNSDIAAMALSSANDKADLPATVGSASGKDVNAG